MVCGDGLNYAAPAKFRVALNVIISTPAVSFCSIPFDRACAMLDRKKPAFLRSPLRSLPAFFSPRCLDFNNTPEKLDLPLPLPLSPESTTESFWTFMRVIEESSGGERGGRRRREGEWSMPRNEN